MIAPAPSSPVAPSSRSGPSVATARDGEAARRALDARDGERCARLPTARARRDFRAGRLAARRAVAGLTAGASRVGGSSVSLAHRDGRGLAAAVGPGARVGVDLEREGTVGWAEARYFLSPREVSACPADDPTVLWTLKEAVWKLLCLSRAVAFHRVEVVPDPPRGVVHVRHAGRRFPVRYRIVRPWPGWTGSVIWWDGEGR